MSEYTLKTVEFLLKYGLVGGLQQLIDEYGLDIYRYDDRIVLNYNQINSYPYRFTPIVRECRGLVLSWPELRVLCRSFDRFYNYGEDPGSLKFAEQISQATIYEKIDGSLMSVYHDGLASSGWCVSTRGRAFAEGETGNGRTFRDMFEEALGCGLNDVFQHMPKDNWTYIFEMVSPETRVVTPYPESQVYLLAARRKNDGGYVAPERVVELRETLNAYCKKPILLPKTYQANNVDDVVRMAKALPMLEEGYVCHIRPSEPGRIDWRMKIKNPAYLAAAKLHMNGALNAKRISKMVWAGEQDEYLAYFPEDRVNIQPYIEAYQTLWKFLKATMDILADLFIMKDFALAVNSIEVLKPLTYFLFRMKQGYSTAEIREGMLESRVVDALQHMKNEIVPNYQQILWDIEKQVKSVETQQQINE